MNSMLFILSAANVERCVLKIKSIEIVTMFPSISGSRTGIKKNTGSSSVGSATLHRSNFVG